eukprot:3092746-Pleurochrysis_carterae.AAC.3
MIAVRAASFVLAHACVATPVLLWSAGMSRGESSRGDAGQATALETGVHAAKPARPPREKCEMQRICRRNLSEAAGN